MTAVVKSSLNDKLYLAVFPCTLLLLAFLLNVSGRLLSAISIDITQDMDYWLSDRQAVGLMLTYYLLTLGSLWLPKLLHDGRLVDLILKITWLGCLLSSIGAFYSDMFYIYKVIQLTGHFNAFPQSIQDYLAKEAWFYLSLCLLAIIVSGLYYLFYKKLFAKPSVEFIKFLLLASALFMPFVLIYPLIVLNIALFYQSSLQEFPSLPVSLLLIQHVMYGIIAISLLLIAYRARSTYKLPLKWLAKFSRIMAAGIGITLLFHLMSSFIVSKLLANRLSLSALDTLVLLGSQLKASLLIFIPIFVLLLATWIFRVMVKEQQFNELAQTDDTSGSFGTASWATEKDLVKLNAFDAKNGISIGGIDV